MKQIFLVLVLGTLLVVAQPSDFVSQDKSLQDSGIVFKPSSPPDLLTRVRTKRFIDSIRNINENNATSINRIFFRIGALVMIDPDLSNLTQSMKDYLIAQILNFQNANGGFGDWIKDRSSVSATFKAVSVLNWLGYTSLNTTKVKVYLDKLFVGFSGKFKTYLSDTDGDIYATSLAIQTYNLLGEPVFGFSQANNSLVYSQNLDPVNVPSVEIGGFGLQTNSLKGIYWTSSVVLSAYAIETMNSYGGNLQNSSAAISFLQNMQLSSGGFGDDPYLTSESVTYTERAISALKLLGSAPVDIAKAETFIHSLQGTDGGYKLKPTSVDSSLKGTYYALKALNSLNKTPNNITGILDFLMNLPFMTDGFGANPEDEASLRETFDAVIAYGLMGTTVTTPTGILSYVERYRNLDNGYGLTQSYTESTFRAVSIYNELGVEIPNKAGVISFLQSMQQPDGGFVKSATRPTSYVISTYRAVVALDLLGAAPLDKAGAINFLKSAQQADGGFGGFVGDISDVSSTYRAIRALLILGDTSFDLNGAVNFLRQSQNPDGGFKRSPSDVTLPTNASHAVYTYAAVRGLHLLNATPSNVTGVYDFIVQSRNNDGGYGKRPGFTSDIAYTFTSLYLLSILSEVTNFSVEVPSNLNQIRGQYDNFTIFFKGGIPAMNYSVKIHNTSQVLNSGNIQNPTNVTIDTASFGLGVHILRVEFIDRTRSLINQTFAVLIDTQLTTQTPTTSIQSNSTSTSQPLPTTTSTNAPTQTEPISTGNNQQFLFVMVVAGTVGITIVTLVIMKIKR